MELNLKSKTALVTGSGQGIGLAIAKALQAEGCKVLTNSRTAQSNPLHVQADVCTAEGVSRLQEAVRSHLDNKLDILVCNVGSGKSIPPGTETSQDWQKSLDINFLSTANVIEALKNQIASPSGSILCVSSICGIESLGAPVTYSAAKAALNAYVCGQSRVFAKRGIRINAVAPGNVLFEGSSWQKKLKEKPEDVRQMLESEVALKRFGTAEEIADVALFLVSEKASFVTGTIVVADGGQIRSWM